MRRFVSFLPIVLLTVLAGCGGGEGGSGVRYDLTPTRAAVAPGGAVTLTATYLEAPVNGYAFSVRPNGNGGTVLANPDNDGSAVYTAPAGAGIDVVEVEFLNQGRVVATRTATITTRP